MGFKLLLSVFTEMRKYDFNNKPLLIYAYTEIRKYGSIRYTHMLKCVNTDFHISVFKEIR